MPPNGSPTGGFSSPDRADQRQDARLLLVLVAILCIGFFVMGIAVSLT